jgi:hypothetical protein
MRGEKVINCECGGEWFKDDSHSAYEGEIVLCCKSCGEFYFNAQEAFSEVELAELKDRYPKQGRPPLPDNERKKNRGFKCSDLVWDKIGVLAEKHGISKNEFLEFKALC